MDVEIVGAAAHLFATHGIGATTMAQIAERVGLGVTSIYHYFGNKHEILERIVVDVNLVPLAVADEVQREFADPAERLHAFIRRDVAAMCDFAFDFNEIHRLARGRDGAFERYWADRARLIETVRGFVDDAVERGTFRAVDTELAAVTILANDEAVQNWYRPDSGAPVARTAPGVIGAFVADIALRGLLVDPDSLVRIAAATAPP